MASACSRYFCIANALQHAISKNAALQAPKVNATIVTELMGQMDVNMLDEIGIHNLGDRMVLMDVIDQLKRRCLKPGTRDLEVPGWGGCFIKMFTFDWADTSEGKSGAEIKDELMNANTSIALVSTLTWAIAWDLFFGSSTACYCSTSDWAQCLCGTAWDMEGVCERERV